ncbi:MAG: HAD-IIIA family hydrolase, partial [Bacteroidetes bacterium]|nr:HAD-IIIA family hydrolase [Bacteroidota bacterium]
VVELDDALLVKSFQEKKYYEEGIINAGLYLLHTGKFMDEEFPDKFSFEKDYLEKMFPVRRIYGQVQDHYFIDIGIPEDFQRAQTEWARPPLLLNQVDKSWTLFLDRDGVINHEKKEEYVRNTEEFRFYDGVKDALYQFGQRFGKIIVVTNQRGVSKGLMTEQDLTSIHAFMVSEVEEAGGRIDAIFYCTSLDNAHPDRKPNPGMAYHALNQFPDIDLSKSIIAGNKPSDMLFGRNAGMYTVFIASTNPEQPFPHPDMDARFDSLANFAKAL